MIKVHLGHETDNSNYRLRKRAMALMVTDCQLADRQSLKLISSVGCWSNDCLEADLGAVCISKSEISKA